jgi:hypothetical protein
MNKYQRKYGEVLAGRKTYLEGKDTVTGYERHEIASLGFALGVINAAERRGLIRTLVQDAQAYGEMRSSSLEKVYG